MLGHRARRSRPACSPASPRSIDVLIVARLVGGFVRRHGLPDDAGPDHCAVGRARRGRASIALWSALGGAIAALGPLLVGFPAGALRLGLGLPGHAAARGGRAVHGLALRAGPRERDDRAGRQPRRHPVGRAGRRAGPRRSTSRRCRTGARSALGLARRSPSPRASRSSSASGARRTRCTTSRSPRGGRSGSRPAPGSSCSAR